MGIMNMLENRPKKKRGTYAAAESSRLTASLANETEFINRSLRYELRTLRARSRQASQNNPYAKRFFQMVVDNVCGSTPFKLQAKTKFNSGKLDTTTNKRIEDAWRSWSRKGQCEITNRMSWGALQRLVVRTLAIDGEVLLRKYLGDGKHGYQLQIIDADRLDEQKNESFPNGGAINMGIQMDSLSRPTAYHLLKRKPSTWERGYTREYDVIPANEIIHIYISDFAEQVRGIPWVYAALLNLVHLGAFEEAAVIAARVGASQMGVITSPDGGAQYEGDDKDEDGNPIIEAEPGTFPVLPPGYEINGWNPKYPDAAIEPFVKNCLRGVSAGMGVAYHNLANNLEGVNYSSARVGELSERDSWKVLQTHLTEHFHDGVYDDWLKMQILKTILPFDMGRIDKYKDILWQPRRWQWVDPKKETESNIAQIGAGIKSRTKIAAEQGDDIEDVFDDLVQEQTLASDLGLNLTTESTPTQAKPDEESDGKTEETE